MRYTKVVANLCKRMDRRMEKSIFLKGNGQYKIEKRDNTLKLYHYGVPLGGVRFEGEEKKVILGWPVSLSDRRALNTMWKYYGVGKRVHLLNNEFHIEIVNECTDNVRLDV